MFFRISERNINIKIHVAKRGIKKTMTWNPVVYYRFENHAAVDDSNNGNNGFVELPSESRWIDLPIPQVATAIKFDHPESKITLPPNQTLVGWSGFRIVVTFNPAPFNRRINLVESDGGFAFFVESDGRLMGTINDGKRFYGVESSPGTIKPGIWYTAEFRYDPASSFTLFLDGKLIRLRVTNSDPVLPPGLAGIRIGYWPGGDNRYTFLGLMGPVTIYTLDPEEEIYERFGKFACENLGKGEDIFNIFEELVDKSLTPSERLKVENFTKRIIDGAKITIASTLGTSGAVDQTLTELRTLSDQIQQVLIRNSQAGKNYFTDPEYINILREAIKVIEGASPIARDTLFAQVFRILSAQPFTQNRAEELLKQYPKLKECLEEIGTTWKDPKDNPIGSWLDDCVRICRDGTAAGGKDANPGKGSNHGKDCEPTQPPTPGTTVPSSNPSNVHIHINCCNSDGVKNHE